MSDPGVPLSGLTPTPPAVLRANLVAAVLADDPGFTANLPASLVEDLVSTGTGILAETDSAKVETVNSLTPYGANPFVLTQLGNIYGTPIGLASNTSVYLVFTGPNGLTIPIGFTVTDGSFQYRVVDGGVIGAGGVSDPIYALATIQGSWAVPSGTVTGFVTSVPSSISLSVNNPQPGIPGIATGETLENYRARVLQAGLAASQGMPRYLKTLLGNVPGVQSRLISVRQVGTLWEMLVGGGDPYAVANAIWTALFDPATLTGSVTGITGITQTTLGVVTTNLNHGLTSGQSNVRIAGVVGMTGANGGPYTVTVLTPTTFTFGVNTSGFGAYVSGGTVTPNTRTAYASIYDYPDTYTIPIVIPPLQTVTVTATWNTDSTNVVNPAAVAQLGGPAIAAYINSVAVGQPINIRQAGEAFAAAISPVLPSELLSRLVLAVSINGISTAPASGTFLVNGDPESYFYAVNSGITVVQG